MDVDLDKCINKKEVKKPLRILHFVSSLDRGSGVMGVIMNYYRNINRDRVQFDFIYFIDKEVTYQDEINSLGGKIYNICSPKKYLKFVKEFKELFTNKEYVILHLHEVYLNALIKPIARDCGFNYIIGHSHATKYSDKRMNAIRNRILCIPLKKNVDYFMACSKAAGAFLYGEKDVLDGKVFVLNNAIDCEKFKYSLCVREKIRNELQLNDKLVIGHIGRFNKQKNHVFLIEIFAEIYKKQKDAILLLVGDGPLKEKIKKLVEKYGVEKNVLFLGLRTDVHEVMQAMDVFVLPSLYEGLPVIGVEVQASGLPCVMSDTVTKEIDLTKVSFISLKEKSCYWADSILRASKRVRVDNIEVLGEAGFDVRKESKNLEEYYLSLF